MLKCEIQSANECINLIVKYLKQLGISNSKKYEKKKKILASEVSNKAHQKTDIESIKEKINELEEKVKGTPSKKDV